MSSRRGLWLRSIRSVSPRVPTVEYARSERSSAKSSQAAWNSALSRALSSSLRRRQAGSSLKNVNLTNVRAATRPRVMAAALATGALLCGWVPPAEASVTLAVLPPGATVSDLAHAGFSPGVISAGIESVPAEQTYLDISQGNRVNPLLYDRDLPALGPFGNEVPGWAGIIARADSAPADLVPGLLASELRGAGVSVSAEGGLAAPALAAADRHGLVRRSRPGRCLRLGCRGLAVIQATVPHLEGLVRRLQEDDLLIAF